eukprot:3490335-Pleurochrysis_carterae.AAC.1
MRFHAFPCVSMRLHVAFARVRVCARERVYAHAVTSACLPAHLRLCVRACIRACMRARGRVCVRAFICASSPVLRRPNWKRRKPPKAEPRQKCIISRPRPILSAARCVRRGQVERRCSLLPI